MASCFCRTVTRMPPEIPLNVRVFELLYVGTLPQGRSNERSRRSDKRNPPTEASAIPVRSLSAKGSSEKRVALRQRQRGRRLTAEKLTICAHFVSFRIDADFRKGIVPAHAVLGEVAAMAHRLDSLHEAVSF